MIQIAEWELGLVFWPAQQAALRMYLWFYEWNLFDAVVLGEHTHGYGAPRKAVSPDLTEGTLAHPGLNLEAVATEDGAQLNLTVHNESDHDWPDVAAIIPCFNPGAPENDPVPATTAFFDEARERTWFASAQGLERLTDRAIHFNAAIRPSVEARSENGRFVFSDKWPTSPVDAASGILIRESSDRRWVAGIAWKDYLSAQGHNPWRCMHLSIRVGPLARGERREVRGRIYLMQGTKENCYDAYHREFA